MFWNWFPLLEPGWYFFKYTEIYSLIFWSLSVMLANPMIFPSQCPLWQENQQGWNSNDVSSHLEVPKSWCAFHEARICLLSGRFKWYQPSSYPGLHHSNIAILKMKLLMLSNYLLQCTRYSFWYERFPYWYFQFQPCFIRFQDSFDSGKQNKNPWIDKRHNHLFFTDPNEKRFAMWGHIGPCNWGQGNSKPKLEEAYL